jgi:uncharacterized membrane protein YeiB
VALKRQAAPIHRSAAFKAQAADAEEEMLLMWCLARSLADLAVEQEATAEREHSQALPGTHQQHRHHREMQEEATSGNLSRDLQAVVVAAQVPWVLMEFLERQAALVAQVHQAASTERQRITQAVAVADTGGIQASAHRSRAALADLAVEVEAQEMRLAR